MEQGHDTEVTRRRVFYIPGFDPYPPRRYRELYRKESQAQAQVSGYHIEQSAVDGENAWTVDARMEGRSVQTRLDVLQWSDLVQHSMRGGIVSTYVALVRTSWIYLSTGTFPRLARLAKGPVLAALYPIAVLLLQLAIAIGVAIAFGRAMSAGLTWLATAAPAVFGWKSDAASGGLATVSTIIFWLGFAVAGVALLRWFRSLDDKFFAYYLMQDYAHTASARGAYPSEIQERLSVFGESLNAAMEEDVDEVLVIGHSSGAHLAVSLVADHLKRVQSPSGRPALSLLTLGHVIPMVSFLPNADRLRRDLKSLSTSDDITWLDVSAPGDGCCFALSDPVSVSGVAPKEGQRWPVTISAAFSQTLSAKKLKDLRYRFFRLHFQYLCAFDQPRDYDYFKITAGPLTLGQRFEGRKSSKSRIDVPASRYTSLRPAVG